MFPLVNKFSMRFTVIILLAIAGCGRRDESFQGLVKEWTRQQEIKLSALEERTTQMERDHQWEITKLSAAGTEGIFLLDRANGKSWFLGVSNHAVRGWYPIPFYEYQTTASALPGVDWLDNKTTAPAAQPAANP